MSIVKLVIPALLSSLCNTLANTIWKMQLNKHPLQTDGIINFLSSVVNISIISGMILYAVSMLIYFYLLSHYRLSDIVPFLAMTYVFSFFAAYFAFGEVIAMKQIIGMVLIMTGIIVSHFSFG